MIDETQTHIQTPTPEQEDTSEMDKHWSDIELMNRATQAARQNYIDENHATETHEETIKKKTFKKGVAVGVIASTAVAGVGVLAYEAGKDPTFSETSHEYVVQPGDGLYNAAEDIKGINDADIRDAVKHISVDPANIDVLKDGLQPGETLSVPDSVQK